MTGGAQSFEALLRQALTPVDPPAVLSERIESTLESLTELAQEELDGWEMHAMRDPRNWIRPAAAAVVGTTAGAALVLMRARRRHQRRKTPARNAREFAERALEDIRTEARRLLE